MTKPAGSPDRWLVTLTEVRQLLGSSSKRLHGAGFHVMQALAAGLPCPRRC